MLGEVIFPNPNPNGTLRPVTFPFIHTMLDEVELRALSRPGQSSSSSVNEEKHMSMDLTLCLEALKQQWAKHKLMPNSWRHTNFKNNKILYHVH